MNLDELLRFLVQNGQSWVQEQQRHYRPSARPLTPSEKLAFAPFFSQHILDVARIKRVPSIENPGFYAHLEAIGVPTPLDFTAMEGITFVDTILVSQNRHRYDPPLLSLLFHELVHIVQYSFQGKDAFVEHYVQGWAEAGRDYLAIPLEKDAYQLQARYERQPDQAFSVDEAVWIHLGLG